MGREESPQPRVHGFSFEDAARIFEGPTVERVDDRFAYGERRVYAVGLVNGREITVIYTGRDRDQSASFQRGVRCRMNDATTRKSIEGESD